MNFEMLPCSSLPWDLLRLNFGSWFDCSNIFALTGPAATLFCKPPVFENWFLEDIFCVNWFAIIKNGSSFSLSAYLFLIFCSNLTKLDSIYLIPYFFLSSFYTFAFSLSKSNFYYLVTLTPESSLLLSPYGVLFLVKASVECSELINFDINTPYYINYSLYLKHAFKSD